MPDPLKCVATDDDNPGVIGSFPGEVRLGTLTRPAGRRRIVAAVLATLVLAAG